MSRCAVNGVRRFAFRQGARKASVLAVFTALGACAPSPSEYTVDYYQAHPAEREAKLAQCANDPGALRDDALCVNAREAGVMEGIGSFRDLPPIGLVESEERRQRERQQQQQ